MNILILCQGQQRRLPDLKHPKHLLEVGGEPIVMRTLRMLGGLGVTRAAVYHHPGGEDLADAVHMRNRPFEATHPPPYSYSMSLRDPGSCIVDGILGAVHLQEGRHVVLLGDVVWSWAALEKVLADKRPIVFAGTPVLSASEGEVFALAFDDPQEVGNLCTTCPCRVDGSRVRSFMNQQGGHLRRLLWWTQEVKRLRVTARARQTWHPDVYLPIEDWTNDVDTPADVARLPELARLAELEERERSMPLLSADPPGWRDWVVEEIDRGKSVNQVVDVVMRRSRGRLNPATVSEFAYSLRRQA